MCGRNICVFSQLSWLKRLLLITVVEIIYLEKYELNRKENALRKTMASPSLLYLQWSKIVLVCVSSKGILKRQLRKRRYQHLNDSTKNVKIVKFYGSKEKRRWKIRAILK